jgi:hypothetical protein
MPQTPQIRRPAFPIQAQTNLKTPPQPTPTSQSCVEKGIPSKPAASIWEATSRWVSDVTQGFTGLFSFSASTEIDYARMAPSDRATPEVVLDYIQKLKNANLSDKELAKCLNKVAAHAAAHKDIKTAYKGTTELMRDSIWKDVALTNLAVKRQVLPTILTEIHVPKNTPHTLRNEFFSIASMQNPAQRRSAFTALALKHVGTESHLEELKLEYLTYAKDLTTDAQKREALAPFAYIGLTPQQFNAYINVVQTIGSRTIQADCLAEIAKFCPDDAKFPEIVRLIRDLRASRPT